MTESTIYASDDFLTIKKKKKTLHLFYGDKYFSLSTEGIQLLFVDFSGRHLFILNALSFFCFVAFFYAWISERTFQLVTMSIAKSG